MEFDPKKYLAEKTGNPSKSEEQSIGVGDVLRPIAQGASLGFSDEAAGGLGALKDIATGKTGLDWQAIKQAYQTTRDQERSLNKQSEERNPNLYKTLEIASGLISPIGTVGKVAKGASLAARAGKLALEGGLIGGATGAGFSEGKNLGEVATDTLGGAAVGLLPGTALGGAGVAAKIGEHVPFNLISSLGKGAEEGLKGNLPSHIKLTENVDSLLNKLVQSGDNQKVAQILEQIGVNPKTLYTKNLATGESELNPKALSIVQNMLKKSVNEKASGDVAKRSVDLLEGGAKSVGVEPNMNSLLEKAKSSNVFDQPKSKLAAYLGYGSQKTLSAEPTVRALSMAPEALDSYDRKPHNSYELSKSTKTASKEEMAQLANTAMSIPGLENQGTRLKEAVDEGNLRATNQLMFDLLQRPKFRNSVEGMISDKEENDQ